MITASDSEYKATKRIKQGKERLEAPFEELADWIRAEWNARVLNIILDSVEVGNRPRLQIILEFAEDEKKFHCDFDFDETKQTAIATKFLEISSRSGRLTAGADVRFAKCWQSSVYKGIAVSKAKAF